MSRKRMYSARPTRGGAALSRAMNVRRIRREGSRFVSRPSDVVLNWGSSELPYQLMQARIINRPQAVALAVNKIRSFERFSAYGVPTVDWTTDQEVARGWLNDNGTVVCRGTVEGRAGSGISIVSGTDGDDLPDVPLYTRYAKKRDEYRVHVLQGRVIRVQHKRRRSGVEHVDSQVRSGGNGWVFCQENVDILDCVAEASVKAVASLHLHYGAVDVGYNAYHDRAYVYEVNTAPGMEGTTLEIVAGEMEDLMRAIG